MYVFGSLSQLKKKTWRTGIFVAVMMYLRTQASRMECCGTLAGTMRAWTSSHLMQERKARSRFSLSSLAVLKSKYVKSRINSNQEFSIKPRGYEYVSFSGKFQLKIVIVDFYQPENS
jgi:hypothetical protein